MGALGYSDILKGLVGKEFGEYPLKDFYFSSSSSSLHAQLISPCPAQALTPTYSFLVCVAGTLPCLPWESTVSYPSIDTVPST